MIVYDFNPNSLPDELHLALGLLVTSSSQTEGVIDMAIACCLGIPDVRGKAVTTHMSMPQRFSALRSAAALPFGEQGNAYSEIIDVVTKLDREFEARNRYVHQSWCLDPDGKLFLARSSARKRIEIKVEPASVDEVAAACRRIYQLGMQLMTVLDQYNLFVDY